MREFRIALLVSAAVTVSCAGRGSTPTAPSPRVPAARITYRFATVSLAYRASYLLNSCTKPEVKVRASLSPVLRPSDEDRTFDPVAIGGRSRKTVDLRVELYENGTLKSVNAGAADRTAAILVNTLKTIASFAALAAAFDPANPFCNKATQEAMEKIEKLQLAAKETALKRRTLLLTPWTPSVAKQLAQLAKRDAALTAEIAAIRAESLSIDYEREFALEDSRASYELDVPALIARKWFADGSPGEPLLQSELLLTGPGTKTTIPDDWAPSEIAVRVPQRVSFRLCDGRCAQGRGDRAKGELLVPQWGQVRSIDFAVGFAEERTVGLSLDAAGGITALTYKRNARAEAATGAFASIATEAAVTAKAVEHADEDTRNADLKRELDYYDLQNKLKEAKDKYNAAQ